ncbi:MAG: hypothetical protein ACREAA_20475 [Candidatus Polarisedimenticolia bacterium]
MSSGSGRRLRVLVMFVVLWALWPVRAAGYGGTAQDTDRSTRETRARLTEGFRQILAYFDRHELSLLNAWREMRASSDPNFFERTYPGISAELDAWAAGLERQFGPNGEVSEPLDFTFLLEEFAPVALDPREVSVRRDNAMATISMVCLMDTLRCEPALLHHFLSIVVARDPSSLRKAEALRCWRRSGGRIDEGLLEQVLSSPAAFDLELRAEAAKILFSLETPGSLQAQRRLISTEGVSGGSPGEPERIACESIRRLAAARFEPAAPDLIGALDDPAAEVRLCAAEGLAQLSGRRPAFDPRGPAQSNDAAREEWRSWWRARAPRTGSAGL